MIREVTLSAELVADAVQMAVWRRRPPKDQTVAHSDHGGQYTSWLFGTKLRAYATGTLVCAVQRIQCVNTGQVVVVGQDQELISVLAIPADNVFGSRIAIAVGGMRMEVPTEPVA